MSKYSVFVQRYARLISGRVKICEYNEESVCIEYLMTGDKYWLRNNRYHNREGPAVEGRDEEKSYWINGKNYSYSEWLRFR